MRCPKCNGIILKKNPKRCQYCGFIFNSEDKTNEGTPQPITSTAVVEENQNDLEDKAKIKVCKNCGAKLKPDNNFCEKCGKIIISIPTEESSLEICSSCGKQLKPNAKFCAFCGTRVSSTNAIILKERNNDEEILDAFSAVEIKFGGGNRYLAFTQKRILVVKREALKESLAYLAFGPLLGDWLLDLTENEKAQRPKQYNAEKILNSDPKNYDIPYSEVIKVELKKLNDVYYSAEIRLLTNQGKGKFRARKVTFEKVLESFRRVLPNKISII